MSGEALSLKERIEAQLISELNCDKALRDLMPVRQNQDSKPKVPYISVAVTLGKEISPGAGIFNASGAITFHFEPTREGQGNDVMDASVRKAFTALSAAQARGQYGLIIDGEQPVMFDSDTIRRRTIALRIIAG